MAPQKLLANVGDSVEFTSPTYVYVSLRGDHNQLYPQEHILVGTRGVLLADVYPRTRLARVHVDGKYNVTLTVDFTQHLRVVDDL